MIKKNYITIKVLTKGIEEQLSWRDISMFAQCKINEVQYTFKLDRNLYTENNIFMQKLRSKLKEQGWSEEILNQPGYGTIHTKGENTIRVYSTGNVTLQTPEIMKIENFLEDNIFSVDKIKDLTFQLEVK